MDVARGKGFFWFTITVIFFLIAEIQIVQASDANGTIVWATADRPTSYIMHGDDKGRGVVDELYQLLRSELPEYQHKMEVMTFSRVLAKMEAGDRVCSVGFKKPDRERVGLFSDPAIITIPFSIMSKKGVLEKRFNGKRSLDLRTLFTNENIVGAVRQKRSYGEINDKIMHYLEMGRLKEVGPGANLIKMLLHERVDFVIEIPSFLMYRAKQQGHENKISSFAIADYQDKVLIAYVFCTKGAMGSELS